MSFDPYLGGLLLPGERPFLNRVFESIGELEPLNEYAAWLRQHGSPRGEFLETYSRALQSWNVADFPDPATMPEPWLELIGHRIVRRLADRGLSQFSDLVFSVARPALRIIASPEDDEQIPVGGSKFGGSPDLPAGFEWPIGDDCRATYNLDTAGEQPLAGFLGQLNLDELADTPAARLLPDSGLLSFFGFQNLEDDNPDLIGVMARWFPDCSVLVRGAPPAELTKGNECFAPAEITFQEFFDLPSRSGPWKDDLRELDETDREAFRFGTWSNIRNVLGYGVGTGANDPTPDKESRHLIFIKGTELTDWVWPDLHIQIGIDDLRERAFDRIRLVWVDWD